MQNNPGQTIAYLSDTGAYKYKPLFIAGSTVMVVLLDLGMIAERWLRHTGDLTPNTSWWQKSFSILAIIAAIAGAAGLILLSCFDTYRHPKLHDKFLVLFIVGYVISAIFMCAEYQRLGSKYKRHPILKASFRTKLAFIIIEVALAIRMFHPIHVFTQQIQRLTIVQPSVSSTRSKSTRTRLPFSSGLLHSFSLDTSCRMSWICSLQSARITTRARRRLQRWEDTMDRQDTPSWMVLSNQSRETSR